MLSISTLIRIALLDVKASFPRFVIPETPAGEGVGRTAVDTLCAAPTALPQRLTCLKGRIGRTVTQRTLGPT